MPLSCSIRGSLKNTARVCTLTAACTVGLLVSASLDSAQAGKGFGNNASMSGGNKAIMVQTTKASSNSGASQFPPGTQVRDHRRARRILLASAAPPDPDDDDGPANLIRIF
jgi:hypothetical protein